MSDHRYTNKYSQSTTFGTPVSSSSYQNIKYEIMSPKLAFKHDGIEFWGSSKTNLNDIEITVNDLILNASQDKFFYKPFIKGAPPWINVGHIDIDVNQVQFNWKDFGAPPSSVDFEFWKNIVQQAKSNGIKRIICCCGAGLGRTGTMLAALRIALSLDDEPEKSISYIRKNYSNKAIETDSQELYIIGLVYDLTYSESYSEEIDYEELPPEVGDLISKGEAELISRFYSDFSEHSSDE